MNPTPVEMPADGTDPTTRRPSPANESVDDIARIDAALGRIRRSMARRGLGRRVLDELGLDMDAGLVDMLDAVESSQDTTDDAAVSVGTVAARLGVDPSQASRTVAEGVRAGLVRRVAAQEDGRRIALKLSPDGEALLERIRRKKHEILASHLDRWTADEIAEFSRLLARFATIAPRDKDG